MDDETKELCRFYEKMIAGLEEEVNRYKSLVDLNKIGKIVTNEIEELERNLTKERAIFKYTLAEKEDKISSLEAMNADLVRQVKLLKKRNYELLPPYIKREIGGGRL